MPSVSFTNTAARSTSRRRPTRSAAVTCSRRLCARVSQSAFGGSEGTANASFVNNAPLIVTAYATGLGGGDGTAYALATGIFQQAGAGGGATASVYNTNAIAVTASANVTVGNAAHRGSYALATAAALGVSQSASGGTASADGDRYGLHRRVRGVALMFRNIWWALATPKRSTAAAPRLGRPWSP